MGVLEGKRQIWGEFGRPIVTNGDFATRLFTKGALKMQNRKMQDWKIDWKMTNLGYSNHTQVQL